MKKNRRPSGCTFPAICSNGSVQKFARMLLLAAFFLNLSPANVFAGNELLQQARPVSGKVITNNQPLPGATVLVKGTANGTVTNENGNYSLSNVPENAVLVFSFIGMISQEKTVGNNTTINVTMEEETIGIEEVVAIGYGTVKRRDLTGSTSSVKVSELSEGATTSIDQLMIGKSAGVNVVQNSGEPGGAISINIRGSGSIGASNSPLFVIDGIPFNDDKRITTSNIGYNESNTPRNPLSGINPGDIESIEILKDASATAIYGSRAANGVVLITTKSGKNAEMGMQVNFHSQTGIQNWSNKIEVLNAQQYKEALNAIIDAGGEDPSFRVGEIANGGKGTDWQEAIQNDNALIIDEQLSITGHLQKTSYYLSLNYKDQEGTIKGFNHKNYSSRINLDSELSEKLRISLKASGSYREDEFAPHGRGTIGGAGVIRGVLNFDPTLPIKNKDGSFALNELISIDNPVALIEGVDDNSNIVSIFSNFSAEYDITNYLTAKVRIGGDFTNENRKSFVDKKTREGRDENGFGRLQNSESSHYLLEGLLSYVKSYDFSDINAVGGITYERFTTDYLTMSASNFPSLELGANKLNLGEQSTYQIGNSKYGNRLASYLGRVNYTVLDKYLFTLSGRLDGSSRFGKNNKFAFFPSAAVGWRLSEENFMDGIEAINNLKLTGSWGMSGNQEIGDYTHLTTYTAGGKAVLDNNLVNTTTPTRMGNPNLKWETTEQLNFGLNFGILNYRIDGNIDYYIKTTKDLLLDVPIPTSSGFNTMKSNVGNIENKGFELSLNSRNIKTKNFSWSSNLNFTTFKNKVINNGGFDIFIEDIGWGTNTGIIREGEPLKSFYGWEAEGIWQEKDDFSVTNQNVQPGDIKFKDQNGDGYIQDDDRIILGNSFPDFFWSIVNTFNYKGFELFVFITSEQGFEILNENLMETYYPINFPRNKYAEPFLNRWTPENPSNKYPSFVNTNSQGKKAPNSLMIEDGSYVKLKTMRISYDVSKLFHSFRNAQVYIVGDNLYTFTNFMGIDPAANARGNADYRMERNPYPTSTSFMLGIILGF